MHSPAFDRKQMAQILIPRLSNTALHISSNVLYITTEYFYCK